jgi:hypothetical protein
MTSKASFGGIKTRALHSGQVIDLPACSSLALNRLPQTQSNKIDIAKTPRLIYPNPGYTPMDATAIINPSDTRPNLTPELRAFGEPIGIPCIMGDGNTWLIAECGLAEGVAIFREALYRNSVLTSTVQVVDAKAAAYYGLMVNYELTDEEAKLLLKVLDVQDLATSACQAIIPIEHPRRTFDDWAYGSLFANGIDPARVPPHYISHVLDILVRTNRTVPHHQFTEAGIAASKTGKILSQGTPKPLLKTE